MRDIVESRNLSDKQISLREARLRKGLTMKWVAEKVGVTEGAMCRYEKGERKVPFETAKQLAEIYGVSLEELKQN